ncbi:DUF4019 domain-containing protein [Paraburkholderia denitrificans]|uniref:DUF4019 domain-containing protein n=1 Tax=Paraburkholderia denitrificans TaxID=694025 RepID=A0ABW0J4C8_9BURK
MANMLIKSSLTIIALAAALNAHAQSNGESANELLQEADAVFRHLDNGQIRVVWNGAAKFVKDRIEREKFETGILEARKKLGTVNRRGWAQITRIIYKNALELPDGLYANIDYATTLATGANVFEKLSFRLEDDGRWHFTGYVPRQEQGAVQ